MLTGGRGADRFVFVDTATAATPGAAPTVITDFARRSTCSYLAAIDAREDPSGNDQAFEFIGDDGFDARGAAPGDRGGRRHLRRAEHPRRGGAEAMIRIEGLVEMNAADFVL